MRHQKRLKKLGLGKDHRDALLANLATSLILHGKLKTTKARAKALSSRIDRLITIAKKKEPMLAIRFLKPYLTNEEASRKLLNELKKTYENRHSGFTRVVAISRRKGDNAPLYQISFV